MRIQFCILAVLAALSMGLAVWAHGAIYAQREAVDAVSAPAPAPQAAAPVADSQSSLQSQPTATPAPVSAASVPDPAEADTFGRRMVLSQGEDEDGIPAMPPAQKILIALCLIAAL